MLDTCSLISLLPKTDILYLCNPNNPTGSITPDALFRPFCQEMSQRALVFIDEAYHEYVSDPRYRSMVELVKEGHNVLVRYQRGDFCHKYRIAAKEGVGGGGEVQMSVRAGP